MSKSTSFVFTFMLIGASATQAQLVDPPMIAPVEPPVVSPAVFNPPDPSDSPIFGEIREGEVLLFTREPLELIGIEFLSAGGNLVPVDDRIGASPFTFFLSNSPNQITWVGLGSTLTLDGVLNTSAGFIGDPAEDLRAFWGSPTRVPFPFPVSLSNEPIPGGFESPDLPPGTATPVPEVVEPLVDQLPVASGDVRREIRDGKIVVITSAPVQAAGLDFQSAAGRLVPVSDPLGASPFTFLLANTPNQITLGNLASTVTIDGELVTEAGYTGDAAAGDLRTFFGDGLTAVEFFATNDGTPPPVVEPPVVETPVVEPPVVEPPIVPVIPDPPVVDPPAPNMGPLTGVVSEDGIVVLIATEPIEAVGIELQSAAGNLIPVSEEIGASPFTFFLSNTSNQITWGTLATPVTLDGDFVTGAGYNGDPEGDLVGFFGSGSTPVAFAITAGTAAPVVPGNEVIPEPNAISLALLAMLGLVGLRRRRR